jgi:hypothetical protein
MVFAEYNDFSAWKPTTQLEMAQIGGANFATCTSEIMHIGQLLISSDRRSVALAGWKSESCNWDENLSERPAISIADFAFP